MGALKLLDNYYPLPIDEKRNDKNNKGKKVVKKYRKRIVATAKTRKVLLDFAFCGFGMMFFMLFVYWFLYLASDCVNYM